MLHLAMKYGVLDENTLPVKNKLPE